MPEIFGVEHVYQPKETCDRCDCEPEGELHELGGGYYYCADCAIAILEEQLNSIRTGVPIE